VNVVVPQPLSTTAPSVPNTNDGNTNTILSPIEKAAFSANMNDTDDGADVTAFEITKELHLNIGKPLFNDASISDIYLPFFRSPV